MATIINVFQLFDMCVPNLLVLFVTISEISRYSNIFAQPSVIDNTIFLNLFL